MKRDATVFLLAVVIWTAVGYFTGEARGRGWRGAMIRAGKSHVACTLAEAR